MTVFFLDNSLIFSRLVFEIVNFENELLVPMIEDHILDINLKSKR